MTGSVKKLVVISLVLFAAAYGCGNPMDSSSTDGEGFAPAALGIDLCYTCHAEVEFPQWLLSRHSNFDWYDTTTHTGGRVDPFDMAPYTYADIQGDPSYYSNPGYYPFGCRPCHMGADDSGQILDTNATGTVFDDPDIGRQYRFMIGCEGCHVSGAGHFGGSSPPYVPVPALHECTECHPPTDPMLFLGAFAGAGHTDHHGPDSDRRWYDGSTSLNSAGGPAPALTTVVLASQPFDAYMVSASWIASDGGSYYFDGEETINDTHYQGIWVTDVANELLVYEVPTSKFGYVDLANTSPNTGMVRADSVDACTASCHGAHEFDLAINLQWFEGAHHPNIEGPIGTTTSRGNEVLDVPGPANWGAVDHGYGEGCLRCHTSMGFAEVAPGYGDAVQVPADESDGFITCNGCHDGVNYPTSEDKRLRFYSVSLFDYQGQVIRPVNNAGNSAACIYCHQGREDGSRMDDDAATYNAGNMAFYMTSPKGNPVTFRNMHYLAAGAVLYAEKGYEYKDLDQYSGEHFHALVGCTGCHMADEPDEEDLGGHTFHMATASTESTTFCKTCHPSNMTFQLPWGGGPTPADDISSMLTTLLGAIEAYDSPDDADTTANVKYQTWYPYFNLNSAQAWDPPLAKAAFNWQFIKKDPGAYAHNPSYALQLLWDSYEDLYNNDNSITPAPGSLSVPRPSP